MKRLEISQWEELPDGYFFTIREVTEVLNVSDGAVRNAIYSCRLRAVRLTGAGKGPYRIKKQWLREYLEECEVEPPQEQEKAPAGSSIGGQLKHIKPTWVGEPSQPSGQRVSPSNGRKARSSSGSCGRGCRQ